MRKGFPGTARGASAKGPMPPAQPGAPTCTLPRPRPPLLTSPAARHQVGDVVCKVVEQRAAAEPRAQLRLLALALVAAQRHAHHQLLLHRVARRAARALAPRRRRVEPRALQPLLRRGARDLARHILDLKGVTEAERGKGVTDWY